MADSDLDPSWKGSVAITLDQKPISESLDSAKPLVEATLNEFSLVHTADDDFWLDLSRKDPVQVVQAVVTNQKELGAKVNLQYVTMTRMLLVLRGAEGTYELTKKDTYDIHDRLTDALKRQKPDDYLICRVVDQWEDIRRSVVTCFTESRLDPRLVTIQDFDRIAKAIVCSLKGVWATWDNLEFAQEVDYTVETYVSRRADTEPYGLIDPDLSN
jgi:hypothetical protein